MRGHLPDRAVHELQMAEGGAFSSREITARFGLSAAVLRRWRKAHRIVYWQDTRHRFFYPAWQFTAAGVLRSGIQEVLRLFQSTDKWRVMRYFLAPRPQLGGKSPLALLRAGRVAEVLKHAQEHVHENTW